VFRGGREKEKEREREVTDNMEREEITDNKEIERVEKEEKWKEKSYVFKFCINCRLKL
jgi:hypothetical protein